MADTSVEFDALLRSVQIDLVVKDFEADRGEVTRETKNRLLGSAATVIDSVEDL